MKESNLHLAELWDSLPDKGLRCELCSHFCLISEGKMGLCKERVNVDGKLFSLNYGRLIAANVDPIEKKPLYHFLPGSRSFSIAAPGCNLRCAWCQNWDISQASERNDPSRLEYRAPESVFEAVLRTKSQSIAYTYTEPTVFFEYTLALSKLAHMEGIKNIYVSNGYMSSKMLDLYLPLLDAVNVDIKAFDDTVYRKYTGARLEPVLENAKRIKEAGVWLEVTTLLVPGVNDDETQLKGLAAFIAEQLGPETPWHLSRFFPQVQFDAIPATSLSSIHRAIEIGQAEGLKFIYGGNIDGFADSYCPSCGESLILRNRILLQENRIKDGRCYSCGTKIAGVW